MIHQHGQLHEYHRYSLTVVQSQKKSNCKPAEKITKSDHGEYEYWNQIKQEADSVPLSDIFRTDFQEGTNLGKRPPTTVYTVISLRQAYIAFWIFYVVYGLVIFLIKLCVNKEFKKAPKAEKVQHIIEVLNIPETYGDWDTNLDLDVNGHKKKWKSILIETIIMSLMQVVSNLIMLVPFFITGKK